MRRRGELAAGEGESRSVGRQRAAEAELVESDAGGAGAGFGAAVLGPAGLAVEADRARVVHQYEEHAVPETEGAELVQGGRVQAVSDAVAPVIGMYVQRSQFAQVGVGF